MILVTLGFIFVAIFCLAYGIYILNDAVKQAAVRRRLEGAGEAPDVLDPGILRSEKMSSVGFLDTYLAQLQLARRIDRLLVQAGYTTTVGVFLAVSLFLAAAGGLLVFVLMRNLLFAAAAAAAAAPVPLLVVLYKKNKRMRAFDELFPDALDLMVNALRAGFALNGAIQLVAEESPDPVGTEFRILFEEQKLGLDIRQAMINLGERMDLTDVGYFTIAVVVQRDTGGNLAEVLEKIAYVIRDRFRILGDVRTFTAQGRLSGYILAVLPIVMAFVLSFLMPGYLRILFDDPFGKVLLTVAVVNQVIGFLVIRKIVSIKV